MTKNRTKTEKPDNGSEEAYATVGDAIAADRGELHGDPLPMSSAVAMAKTLETKEAKFVRLAKFRLPKLLKAARQVSNLGNAASYSYTPEQKQKLLAYASECLREIIDAFSQSQKKTPEIDI